MGAVRREDARVDNEAVLSNVIRWAHCAEGTAWQALRATLETLAERLDRNECRHLAAPLVDPAPDTVA
jgi:uncharacterized protein (DUF2267 family)